MDRSKLISKLTDSSSAKRRPVRILHNSSILSADHTVFQQLDDTSALIHERIAALKTLRSHNKQANATNLLKTEWHEELNRLASIRAKHEKAIQSHLQSMIVNSNKSAKSNATVPNLGNRKESGGESSEGLRADVTSIINFIDSLLVEEERLATSRSEIRDSYQKQLKEVKKIVSAAQKGIQSTLRTGSKNSNESDQGNAAEQKKVVGALLADLLLNLRCDHSQTWQSLRNEENDLQDELQALDRSMNDQFRSEVVQKQDELLQSQLASLLRECTQAKCSNIEQQETPRKSTGSKNTSVTAAGADNLVQDKFEEDDHNANTLKTNRLIESQQLFNEAFLLENDPSLTAILQSYFSQIQCVDVELGRMKDQKTAEVDVLHCELELDPAVSWGGWTRDQHDTFLKIFRKATTTGMQRKKMMEILSSSLPEQSHESILTHEEYVRGVKRIQTKYQQMEQANMVKRQELIIQLTKEVNDYREEKEERQKYEQQLQQQEEKRKLLHDRLDALKEEKMLLSEEKRIQDLLKKEEENQQELLKLQQLEAERQERQRLVAQYREKKRKLLEEQNMQMEMERQRMSEELKKMIEENRSKVEFRAHQIAEKKLQKQLKEQEVYEQEQKRIAALQKLAEQVPYFETIQDIDSRLDQVTASVRGHQYISSDEEVTRGHLPLNGFTDQKVISDARFRLAEALRIAGVAHSTAARDIVQAFHPRPHLAIHGIL